MEVLVFAWWWTSHQSSAHKSLRIFRFCLVSWYPRAHTVWEEILTCFKSLPEYRALDRIDGEPIEFEWNIFHSDSPHCSSATKFKSYCWDWVKHQRILQDGSFSCRCSTTSHEDRKTTGKNASQMLNSFLSLRKDSEQDNGHSSRLDQRKSGILSVKSPQGEWNTMAEKMMVTLAESGHPVFRATSPLSRGVLKSKGGGKLLIHYCADQETIKTVFRTLTSVNQLSLFGAVAEMCEKYESYHDRTGGPVVRGQPSSSFVPSVIKINMPFEW